MDYKAYIREVPDFPKPGIMFRDIMPLLADPVAYANAVFEMEIAWTGDVDAVAALEARGDYFGSPLSLKVGAPFIPIRKAGKLPGPVYSQAYGLEYREKDVIEIQQGALKPGQRVLIVDDVLATGGTAEAAAKLVRQAGAQVAGYAFLIEFLDLGGRSKLPDGVPIQSLVTYGEPMSQAA
jgi:adenine phosphoribosyltransferase